MKNYGPDFWGAKDTLAPSTSGDYVVIMSMVQALKKLYTHNEFERTACNFCQSKIHQRIIGTPPPSQIMIATTR